MLEFIDSPTERTTAATDLLLAVAACACAVHILGFRQVFPWKVVLWAIAFALLAVAGLLGAVVHGLKLEADIRGHLWRPLHLSLGLTIALFVVAAVTDCWGEPAGRRLLPILIAVAVAFFAVTQVFRPAFVAFLVYEALALLAALAIYAYLRLYGQLPGAGWMVACIVLSIVAAVAQASKAARFTLIWEFDHNGVFHLVQTVALFALVMGLRAALAGRQA